MLTAKMRGTNLVQWIEKFDNWKNVLNASEKKEVHIDDETITIAFMESLNDEYATNVEIAQNDEKKRSSWEDCKQYFLTIYEKHESKRLSRPTYKAKTAKSSGDNQKKNFKNNKNNGNKSL